MMCLYAAGASASADEMACWPILSRAQPCGLRRASGYRGGAVLTLDCQGSRQVPGMGVSRVDRSTIGKGQKWCARKWSESAA